MSSTVNPDGVYRDASQVLNPPDERPAWWAESGLPGTDTQQTVVVVGHNYSTRDAPFRSLSVTAPGDLVVMSTAAGVLNYRVETTGPLPKGSLLSENELRAQVPGRLILANCDVRDGEPTNDNFFVVAQLVP
ncbi:MULTISPECIES: class F sortase [Nocardiaceae]|nr:MULTISPECIES: class F sortase [Rhodococcus]NIL76092.1 hypothetical protein [Rhodococcus sp. B10]